MWSFSSKFSKQTSPVKCRTWKVRHNSEDLVTHPSRYQAVVVMCPTSLRTALGIGLKYPRGWIRTCFVSCTVLCTNSRNTLQITWSARARRWKIPLWALGSSAWPVQYWHALLVHGTVPKLFLAVQWWLVSMLCVLNQSYIKRLFV